MRYMIGRTSRNNRAIPGAVRDEESRVQFIEINTLDELHKLIKKVKCAIIVDEALRPLSHFLPFRRRKEFLDRGVFPTLLIWDSFDP